MSCSIIQADATQGILGLDCLPRAGEKNLNLLSSQSSSRVKGKIAQKRQVFGCVDNVTVFYRLLALLKAAVLFALCWLIDDWLTNSFYEGTMLDCCCCGNRLIKADKTYQTAFRIAKCKKVPSFKVRTFTYSFWRTWNGNKIIFIWWNNTVGAKIYWKRWASLYAGSHFSVFCRLWKRTNDSLIYLHFLLRLNQSAFESESPPTRTPCTICCVEEHFLSSHPHKATWHTETLKEKTVGRHLFPFLNPFKLAVVNWQQVHCFFMALPSRAYGEPYRRDNEKKITATSETNKK